MRLVVNGRPRDVAGPATVADLVASLGLRPTNVVVERNGEPVERARFSQVELAEGDVVEVVRAVAGG